MRVIERLFRFLRVQEESVLKNTRTRFTGHPMEMPLSPEIIGRVLDGAGKPIDGLGDIFPLKSS